MKVNSHLHSKRGFTLVEIIVVIMIIVTLAAISYGPITNSLTNAHRQASAKACTDIALAVENFYTDNSCFPVTDLPDEASNTASIPGVLVTTSVDDPSNLVTILLDSEQAEPKVNSKNKRYIGGNTQTEPKDGLYESKRHFGMYDRWGSPYYVILNVNEEDLIDPFNDKTLFEKRVLVYGLGPDKQGGQSDKQTNNKELTADNVFSWRANSSK